MVNVKMEQLLDAGVHLGHKTSSWNPKMFPYIYMECDGIHIIDIVQTSQLLQEACEFVKNKADVGQTFLFVGTKPKAAGIVKEIAERCNAFYVNYKWRGGLLTNWSTMMHRVLKMSKAEKLEDEVKNFTKKELAELRKELDKLSLQLYGIRDMEKLPDALIVVDQNREATAVREAIILDIPVISIVDTNCNPELVDFPIPGNDDSVSSIRILLEALCDSIIAGQENRKKWTF